MNDIIHGDVLDILKSLPNDIFDLSFADPPFNLGKKYNSSSDRMGLHDYNLWCDRWLKQMVRVTKPGGAIVIHNIPQHLIHHAAFLESIATFNAWIAWEARTGATGRGLQPNHYGFIVYTKGQPAVLNAVRHPHARCRKCHYLLKDYGGYKDKIHPFGPLVGDVWTDLHRITHERDNHPCQLPHTVMERLILLTTEAEGYVLDPFLGTGTTAVAAARLGRRYMGVEIDKSYADIATHWLQEVEETKLGDAWVSIYRNQVATLRDKDWPLIAPHYYLPANPRDVDKEAICLCKK